MVRCQIDTVLKNTSLLNHNKHDAYIRFSDGATYNNIQDLL
jgi:hypothetical protein